MKGKIKGYVLLMVLTLALSGCVAVDIEEGIDSGTQKPVVTEVPQAPEITEAPENISGMENTEAPENGSGAEATEAPEMPSEPIQGQGNGSEEEGVLEIVQSAYETCRETYDGLWLEEIKALTVCAATEEYISVNIAVDETLSPTDYLHMELAFENGQWKVTEFTGLYSKNGPYAEELISLEPLACDSVEFPEDTIVPLAMGSTVSVDLNGDGIQELVQVSFGSVCGPQTSSKPAWSAMYHELPVVRIDDYVFDEEYLLENVVHYAENADIATWYIFDVDVNDGYKEIGLHEEGPSDDPYTTLFRYEEGELRAIGGFSDSPIRESRGSWALNEGDDYQALVNSLDRSNIQIQVPGDGTIYATQRIDILETSFAEGLWKLQNGDSFAEAVLELQTREEYEFKGYENRMNSEYCPKVHDELQVFVQKDLTSEVLVLTQGEKVIPYHFYPESENAERNGWIEIVYGSDFEESGWIYVNNHMNIYQKDANGEAQYVGSHELIDNLSFAD